MKELGIIGAGWLGKAFALAFSETHSVSLSQNRSPVALANVNTVLYSYPSALPIKFGQQAFIICLPPSVLQNANMFKQFLKSLPHTAQVLYTSSTGIYEGCQGFVTELNEIAGITERVQLLLDLEQSLLSVFPDACILRLAGLVGPDRNPKNFFQRQSVIPSAEDAINLVHQQDVVRFCQMAMEKKWRGVFNVVAPHHPSKGYFYSSLKKDLNIATAKTPKENARIVGSARTEQEQFEYQYADLLQYFLLEN